MNKVIITGNLTRDPELAETNSGVAVCKFSVAVNRPRTADGQQETDFFNVITWRGLAENVAKYCAKGRKVLVIGSFQSNRYEDKNGVKRESWTINAQEVEFLGGKENGVENGNKEPKQATKGQRYIPTLEELEDDEDMPF